MIARRHRQEGNTPLTMSNGPTDRHDGTKDAKYQGVRENTSVGQPVGQRASGQSRSTPDTPGARARWRGGRWRSHKMLLSNVLRLPTLPANPPVSDGGEGGQLAGEHVHRRSGDFP